MRARSFGRDLGAPCAAAGGRPARAPVVFLRRHRVLFCAGMRSARLLRRPRAARLAARWSGGYALSASRPAHASWTTSRQRDGLAVFRRVFAALVERGPEAGLVWGQDRS